MVSDFSCFMSVLAASHVEMPRLGENQTSEAENLLLVQVFTWVPKKIIASRALGIEEHHQKYYIYPTF